MDPTVHVTLGRGEGGGGRGGGEGRECLYTDTVIRCLLTHAEKYIVRTKLLGNVHVKRFRTRLGC